MDILLDTHTFLWYIAKDRRLPAQALQVIRDPESVVYLSAVSLWEVIVKHNLGKLPLPKSPEIYLPIQRERHQIANLNLDEDSVKRLAKLPAVHRDPFDRMLICQALQHDLTIVTSDPQFLDYPASVLST